MSLIDSHAHLTFPELYDSLDDVVTRFRQAGVDKVITIGTDVADARLAVDLVPRYPDTIYVAAGFHPHEAMKVDDVGIAEMAEIWKQPGVVACGEMGLDYHYDFADRDVQRSVFSKQLTLAIKTDLPLVIHSREAIADSVAMLLDHGYAGRRVVYHCFTGTENEASLIASHGWRISFTGVVTFKNSAWLQDIAKAYPVDELMVETDSPYLSPAPVRGKRPCEPAYVVHTARFLAELRKVDMDEFVRQTAENTGKFFSL